MSVPEKHRAVAHAWVDGAEIEYMDPNSDIAIFNEWTSTVAPAFNESWEYRIKPEKVKKWLWVAELDSRELFITHLRYANKEDWDWKHSRLIQKIDGTEIEVEE